MWLMLIPALLLLIYAFLILWYRAAWYSLRNTTHQAVDSSKLTTKVSVIVPARNEAANIANCLKSILAQQYPAHLLEILVIDDASDDNTAAIAQNIAFNHPNVKVISLAVDAFGKSHKKRAIEKGIASSSGTLIVATDADCTHPLLWIASMVQAYETQGKCFVAAPVMFKTEPKLLSVFQTLDFLSLQGITGASVHRSFHTMCNGANIAYSKQAFNEVNGFAGIDKLPTGDDMLLMHKIFKQYPEGIIWLKNRNALVTTDAAPTWKAFFQQRIRWASKAAYYDDKRIFYVLLLVYLLNVSFFAVGISAFFSLTNLWWLLWLLAGKVLVEMVFMLPVARFFEKTSWLWAFPLVQPLHITYTVIAGWLGKFGKYEWKGRVITHESGNQRLPDQ